MAKNKKKTENHVDINKTAESLATSLIATEGIKPAVLIARLVYQKTLAQLKSLQKRYPGEYS